MADIIDGKAFAAKIRAEVKEDSDKLISQKQVDPCLAVVLVGENPASKVYVGQKSKMAKECNIKTKDYKLEESTDQETLLKLIEDLNNDSTNSARPYPPVATTAILHGRRPCCVAYWSRAAKKRFSMTTSTIAVRALHPTRPERPFR